MTSGDGTSEAMIKGIVTGAKPNVMNSSMDFVDVRDVALAHLKAI